MIINNNNIIADKGNILVTPIGRLEEIQLGENTVINNGNVEKITISQEDIKEVKPIFILDTVYDTISTNYSDLVTELIRKKYSLDDELALIANSRIKDVSELEQTFLEWRRICKETAKKVYNE